jgi:hypothetical protein
LNKLALNLVKKLKTMIFGMIGQTQSIDILYSKIESGNLNQNQAKVI